MKYDYSTLYEKNRKFYQARPLAKRVLRLASPFLTAFFGIAYAVLFITAVFVNKSPDVHELIQILGVPAFCFVLCTIVRELIDRKRPYDADGANIKPIVKKKREDVKSFPSRHVALAVAISILFFSFIPAVGAVLCVFALLLAYVRFAIGLHYPSDLAAGILIGVFCAALGLLI